MTEPTSNIRHVIKAALIASMREADTRDLQIVSGFPGGELQADAIWFGPCTGSTYVPHSKSGRRHRQDDFTLPCIIQAAQEGAGDDDEMADTEVRAAEMLALLENALADDATLGGVPGLQDIGFEVELTGPSSYVTPRGPITLYVADISCSTRYQ